MTWDVLWPWLAFNAFVLGMLALDLGVFHRKAHAVTVGEAAAWSAVWVALALFFNVAMYLWKGKEPALQFLAGYLIGLPSPGYGCGCGSYCLDHRCLVSPKARAGSATRGQLSSLRRVVI